MPFEPPLDETEGEVFDSDDEWCENMPEAAPPLVRDFAFVSPGERSERLPPGAPCAPRRFPSRGVHVVDCCRHLSFDDVPPAVSSAPIDENENDLSEAETLMYSDNDFDGDDGWDGDTILVDSDDDDMPDLSLPDL